MKLTPSTEKDVETLSRWISLDPYHKDYVDPYWWLTGIDGSLLSFRLDDSVGPLCYVRLDPKNENGLIRLHTQFAPVEEVSKLRLVKQMLQCVPAMMYYCRQHRGKGLIFQSNSPLLIDFMKRKFKFVDLNQDQFVWYAGQEG